MDQHSARVLVVFNPTAGHATTLEGVLATASNVWRSRGWIVDVAGTAGPGDGVRLARAAAQQGYDIVVAAGGDGTVNEVVNGLAETETALATLPIGTVNVWAREIGMPMNPRAAAEAILRARRQRIDLGRANDRYFLLMSGLGFDAAVTANVRSAEKRRLGALAYALRAVALGMRFEGTRASIVIDGKPRSGRVLMVVVGNSQLYGGFVKLTARASINDGLLDVCIIRGKTLLHSAPRRVLAIITRRYNLDAEVEYHRARSITVDAQPPLPVQVDGDHIGFTPMTFEAVPGALYALLPPALPPELLREEPTQTRTEWQRLLRWTIRRRNHRSDDATPHADPAPEETTAG